LNVGSSAASISFSAGMQLAGPLGSSNTASMASNAFWIPPVTFAAAVSSTAFSAASACGCDAFAILVNVGITLQS